MDSQTVPARPQIGLYRSGITDEARMEETTVGREDMLVDLIDKIRSTHGKASHQHYVFVGPRGIGKTHFLSLVDYRIRRDPELAERVMVVRFPEEANRVGSFADFLLRVCEILSDLRGDPWMSLYTRLG